MDKKLTMAMFLDLSKAFDTISHIMLLIKLDRMGIRGTSKSGLRVTYQTVRNALSLMVLYHPGN